MKTSGDKIGELAGVRVGLYVSSSCGRCGYGLDNAKDEAVALLSSAGVLDGEALCFKCFADEIGDPRSATHRV